MSLYRDFTAQCKASLKTRTVAAPLVQQREASGIRCASGTALVLLLTPTTAVRL